MCCSALLPESTRAPAAQGCVQCCRLNESRTYATGCTLRFPVVRKVHHKSSVDVGTLADLLATQLESKRKQDVHRVQKTPKKKAPVRRAVVRVCWMCSSNVRLMLSRQRVSAAERL
jgi:hypothetical protein